MRKNYTEGQLRNKAVETLVAWRRQWERKNCEGPSIDSGFQNTDLKLWRLAGRFMELRGIKPRLK